MQEMPSDASRPPHTCKKILLERLNWHYFGSVCNLSTVTKEIRSSKHTQKMVSNKRDKLKIFALLQKSCSFIDLTICLHVDKRPNHREKAKFLKEKYPRACGPALDEAIFFFFQEGCNKLENHRPAPV